jgi:hypothetical protein
MKKGSTLFLKGVLCLMGLAVLALCIFAVPEVVPGMAAEFPILLPLVRPMYFGLWATAIPFFVAIFQAFKLLNYIDANSAFSTRSVEALKRIKYSALAMSGLYLIGMPVVFLIAESDDAPGVVILGLLLALSPTVIAIFAAVLQRLVESAIEIKKETELTV